MSVAPDFLEDFCGAGRSRRLLRVIRRLTLRATALRERAPGAGALRRRDPGGGLSRAKGA